MHTTVYPDDATFGIGIMSVMVFLTALKRPVKGALKWNQQLL
jgi:hypothetical protein